MGILISFISQAFPPRPAFTVRDIDDLDGKVYLVTGANGGLGRETARILYSKNAKVYCAARSKEKAADVMASIRAAHPQSRGELVFLPLDLADLSTIRSSVDGFLSGEDRLDVLFNNAGVMNPPDGATTAQGYELQLGVNNLGAFLLTKLLTPVLVRTAAAASRVAEPSSSSSVRVVWVSSSAAEGVQVPRGGVDVSGLEAGSNSNTAGAGGRTPFERYCASKAGNYLQATEFARRHRADGVVSVPLNPGNLDSGLWRTQTPRARGLLRRFVLHPPVLGAYAVLFAALSPEVTIERSGEWVVPWGRFMKIRKHLLDASKHISEGGTGNAARFWEWNEEQVKPFLY